MMKLSLLVGIAACVGFAPTGMEAGMSGGTNPLKITPELMKELKHFLAVTGHKDVIPVKILSATKKVEAGSIYHFMFVNSNKEICDFTWYLMELEEPGGGFRLEITPELMKELKHFLAETGHKDVIPVKIISAIKD
ncbi:hypothetical protein GE061_011548, partial [Apolygus lucorum]